MGNARANEAELTCLGGDGFHVQDCTTRQRIVDEPV